MQKIELKFSNPEWDIETLEQVLEEFMEEREENQEGPFWEGGCSSYNRPTVSVSDLEVMDEDRVSAHYYVYGNDNGSYERGDWGSSGDAEIEGTLIFFLPIVQGTSDVVDCDAIERGQVDYSFE